MVIISTIRKLMMVKEGYDGKDDVRIRLLKANHIFMYKHAIAPPGKIM